jgi:hypothetical protein
LNHIIFSPFRSLKAHADFLGKLCLLAALGAIATLCCSSAWARTKTTCEEHWFENGDRKPVLTLPCKDRKIQWKGMYFGVIDGKAYFIAYISEQRTGSEWIGRFNTSYVSYSRNYFLMKGPVDAKSLRVLGRDEVRYLSRYATDGRSVFYQDQPIDGARLDRFQILDDTLTAELSERYSTSEWSRDDQRLYHEDKVVPNVKADDIRRVGERLFVSNSRVFEVGINDIRERPDMDASLHHLNWAYSADKRHVYFLGRVVEGADPRSFEVMKPSCPVPGHPQLACMDASRFDEERRKAGFTAFDGPQSAGTYDWYGRDKYRLYIDDKPVEIDVGFNPRTVVSSANTYYFMLPEVGVRSGIYAVTSTYLISLSTGTIPAVKGIEYEGSLSGPTDGNLSDKLGTISTPLLERR